MKYAHRTHHTLEGTTESPPKFIYPKRGKGKHRENPRGKGNTEKQVWESVTQGEDINIPHMHGTPWELS